MVSQPLPRVKALGELGVHLHPGLTDKLGKVICLTTWNFETSILTSFCPWSDILALHLWIFPRSAGSLLP